LFGTQIYNDTLQLAKWYWNLASVAYNRTAKRLFAGRMVGELLKSMDAIIAYQNASNNPQPTPPPTPDTLPPLKFLHFSAHDTTVMPMLVALEVFDGTPPPYAAHVGMCVEVRGSDQLISVQALLFRRFKLHFHSHESE
jgi:hypothetical protein